MDLVTYEARFVIGSESIKEIYRAIIEGGDKISYGEVRRFAADHHWTLKRHSFRSEVKLEATKEALKRKSAILADAIGTVVGDAVEQLQQLAKAREAGTRERLVKVRVGESDEVESYAEEWTAKDHADHAKAREACIETIRKALGVDSLDLDDNALRLLYVPENAK